MTEPTLIDNTHPSYPSPTIQEALCEVRFPADTSQFASQFALVWDRLRGEFAQLETHMDVFLPSTTNGILSGPLLSQPRFLLRHARRSFLLQFSPGAFTLNTLAPYLGWQTMREDIAAAWQNVQEVLATPTVANITVRYINHVPLSPGDPEGWLVAGDYVPSSVVSAVPPFQSRVQTGTGTGDTKTLAIGHAGTPGAADFAMVVDIERISSGNFAADAAQVMDRADALHEDIWDLFEAVKGPRWNDVLEGKPR